MRRVVEHTRNCLTGKEPDTYLIAKQFWSAVGHSLFDSIFKAFVEKSNHGTDELGYSWKDHSEDYKAYGRPDARQNLTLYDNRAVRTPGLRVRPTLPPSINRRWGGMWFSLYIQMMAGGTSENYAKSSSGGSTWEHFKALGYPTLRTLTRDKKLPILNKTGVLQRSLFPWPLQAGIYVPLDRNQIFRQGSGSLEVGTSFQYVTQLDRDRPIWGPNINPWIDRAMSSGSDAIYKYLPTVIEQIR